MVTVYVLRHAQSVGNKFGIRQGQVDFPLSVEGIEQAEKIETVLPAEIQTVYTSDLRRASETAEFGFEREFTHEKTPLLREMDFGRLSGIAQDAYDERLPYHLDSHPDADEAWPDGESALDAYERIRQFCREIAENYDDDDVIAVVSHQGAMFNFRDLSRDSLPMEITYDEKRNVSGFVFTMSVEDGELSISEDRSIE